MGGWPFSARGETTKVVLARQMARGVRLRLVPTIFEATEIIFLFLMLAITIRSTRKAHWESRCTQMGE